MNTGSSDLEAASQAAGSRRRWGEIALLLLLPPMTAIAFYYWPIMRTRSLPLLPGPDAKLYLYQFARAHQVGGRYWELAKDETVGKPYPHGLAKHPGFLEGIDLQEIAAISGHWLGPDAVLHLCVLCIMSFNGWVAGSIIRRSTGSTYWAALGAILMVVNAPTVFRVWGNLNLYKHGFVALAALAFLACVDRPNKWRGFSLGFVCSLILQSSFYYAFLTDLAFGIVFFGLWLRKRLDRRHLVPVLLAAFTYVVFGLVFTFPILTMQNPLAAEYFERTLDGVWTFGAELWQYFRPLVVEDPFPQFNYGGANFPGYFILAGLGAYGIACARGWIAATQLTRMVNWLLLLSGVLFLLSLRGGPGILLFDFVKSFRCFDRGGLIAVGLCCIAAPMAIHALSTRIPNAHVRNVIAATAMALVGLDIYQSHRVNWALAGHCWMSREEVAAAKARLLPAWATWLADQPKDVKLAAFGYTDAQAYYVDMWHNESLSLQLNDHHHQTLNGAEYRLFAADLKMLGATPERTTPAALRFVASLGYTTIAIGDGFLQAHPWIVDLPWLDAKKRIEGWRIFGVNASFMPMPTIRLADAVAALPDLPNRTVPPGAWLTERLELTQDCVVAETNWITVEWINAAGKRIGKKGAAFGQRLFGPDLPGLRFRAPDRDGEYVLRFSVEGQKLAERRFRVVENVATLDQAVDANPSTLRAPIELACEFIGGDEARLVVRNPTNQTIWARRQGDKHATGFEYHPAMSDDERSSAIVATWRGAIRGPAEGRSVVTLPLDLAPGASVALSLRDRLLCGVGGKPRLHLTFAGDLHARTVALAVEPHWAIASRWSMPAGLTQFPRDCDQFIAGDFDGDGEPDQAAKHRISGQWFVRPAKQPSAAPQPWGQWSPDVRWTGLTAGDFNADGKSDIAARDARSGVWWVGLSNGQQFASRPWSEWSNRTEWSPPVAGYFDADRRADLVARPVGSTSVYVARSMPDLLLQGKQATTNFSGPRTAPGRVTP